VIEKDPAAGGRSTLQLRRSRAMSRTVPASPPSIVAAPDRQLVLWRPNDALARPNQTSSRISNCSSTLGNSG
jgi:hypothetical protein